MNKVCFLTIASACLISFKQEAKTIQILHTNDTHSYLENSTHDKNSGGMGRLKSLIDQYKRDALDLGVKTIVLDAGDFLEGNVLYLAEEGQRSLKIHNEIGYDVGALGNHDYLMGPEKLDKLLSSEKLNFSLVAANVHIHPKFLNLKKNIRPFAELEIDGIKIGILGLTTSEVFYKWSLTDCEITNPYKVASYYEDILRKRGNETIIALTHLGVLNDLKLAEKSSKIDLIIGGHSHTALFEPIYGKNVNDKSIPIVQAGMHTEYLGRLLVDIVKGRPLKILKYELIPVQNIEKNIEIEKVVQSARADINQAFGENNLDEILGVSILNSNDKKGMSKWGAFIAETMKESTGSELAIHSPSMNSESFPTGNFTRFDLYNSMPRIFNPKDISGWTIFTAEVKGIWLRSLLKIQTKTDQDLVYSGITIDKDGKVTVNGQPIDPYHSYKVAFTEGIIKGAYGISLKTMAILRNPVETKIRIWKALENKISKQFGPARHDRDFESKSYDQGIGMSILLPQN